MADVINLFSDTQTLPTEEMLRAIAHAELGDDMLGEDPTVNRLEARAAELTGKEAALLVTSGTQGNLVSLMAHGGHGDEVLLDPDAHAYFYEAGAMCSVAGFTPRLVPAERGIMRPEALDAAVRPANVHFPRPAVLWLENTHNRGGGSLLRQDRKDALIAVARRHGLRVHIDGARIFNASVALGVPARELADGADSIQFCLSKGLSCPVGSVVCGAKEFVQAARRARKRVGGAMRQAGIIAACGLAALQPAWIARLAEDHRRARRLAELLAGAPGVALDLSRVETNMVFIDISAWGIGSRDALSRLNAAGLRVSPSSATGLRLVTHRHINDVDIERAAGIVRDLGRALAGGRA
ncbi:MAG TPA: hypothetical protein DCM87_04260 [Planctomycetes bacterium]|nr:hypothetical protein [Planctomycetota bacterium]